MKNWEEKPISQLGKIVTGKTPPKSEPDYWGGGELFVSPKDMERDSFYIWDTQANITRKALDKFKSQRLPKNAVMYTSLSYGFGKIGVASKDLITNQQITSVISNDENNFRFIYYLLRVNTPYIFSYNSGIDTPIVPKSVFEKIKLLIPPLPIQQKIAAVLSAYDDLIENNNRRIAILEKMAEELYREWFVRLRFPGHETVKVVKGVPEGWEVKTVASLGNVITGKTPSTSNSSFYNGEYPFIKTPDMHNTMFLNNTEETLSEAGFNSQKSQIIPERSICVSCIGTGGVVSITTKMSQTNQQINTVVLDDSRFLEWSFFTLKSLEELIKLFGYTGSTMTNLSKGKFKKLKILMPEKDIIYSFNKHTKDIFNKIERLGLLNRKLSTIRNLLLSRLMSGKIDVENLEIKFPESMQEEIPNA